MSLLKRIARFVLLPLLLWAGLMVVPWQARDRAYGHVFRTFGNVTFARFWFWWEGSVRFLDLLQDSDGLISDLNAATPGNLPPEFRPPPPTKVLDTLMVLKNRTTPGAFGLVRTSAQELGYGTTALFLVLALAWPMSWRRRGWVLLWGLLAVHLFIAFRLTLTLVHTGFGADKPYALLDLSPRWMQTLAKVEEIAVNDPTVSWVVAIVIWLVVALPDVMNVLFPRPASGPATKAKPS